MATKVEVPNGIKDLLINPMGIPELISHMLMGNNYDNYSAAKPLTNPIINDIPPWMQYFTQDWINKSKSAPMKYLEGWQENARVPNYNVPLAYLNNMPEAIQWNDVGPAGARWHGYSTTPNGQWLKDPNGSEAHWQYEAEMRALLDKALQGNK